MYSQITKDGSSTLFLPSGVTYHSIYGAVQESLVIFIKNGLLPLLQKREEISILELGFGTGLNCMLSLSYAEYHQMPIRYTAIDAYPISYAMVSQLNYDQHILRPDYDKLMLTMHGDQELKEWTELNKDFFLKKIKCRFESFTTTQKYDIIYHDAFGPDYDLRYWRKPFLKDMVRTLSVGGRLVSYCAQGQFKRDLRSLGLDVQAVAGPPGKREITIAEKPKGELEK